MRDIVGATDERSPQPRPFTPKAKKVLELALRESLARGGEHIGTEHVLRGLLAVTDGVAADILAAHGIDPERVHAGLSE